MVVGTTGAGAGAGAGVVARATGALAGAAAVVPGATFASAEVVAGATGCGLVLGVPAGGATALLVPVGALAAVGWLPGGGVPGAGASDFLQAVVSRAADKAAVAKSEVCTRIAVPFACAPGIEPIGIRAHLPE
jgi:hypothetical protein